LLVVCGLVASRHELSKGGSDRKEVGTKVGSTLEEKEDHKSQVSAVRLREDKGMDSSGGALLVCDALACTWRQAASNITATEKMVRTLIFFAFQLNDDVLKKIESKIEKITRRIA